MPLKLYLRGDTWHYRGTVAGRRLRGSTGISRQNKAVAAEAVAKLEARAWQHNLNPGSTLTFAQAAISYRAAGKPTRFLARVEDFWRDTPIKDITSGAIRSACLSLYPSSTGATRNRAVIVPTQAIINHAAAELELCPKVFVKRWPVPKTIVRAVTWTWVREFQSSSPPALAALADFMFLTGARISEATRLRWRDVNLSQRSALIRQTKTGMEHSAHLPNDLILALANIPGDRHPDARVFGYADRHLAWRAWSRAIKAAGIEYYHPHCCRHGFATSLLRAGVDVVTVAKLGGWKSPAQVLSTYGHASEDRTLTDVLTQPGQEQRRWKRNGDR
jgi:integrase